MDPHQYRIGEQREKETVEEKPTEKRCIPGLDSKVQSKLKALTDSRGQLHIFGLIISHARV